jgi:ribosomal protein S12 methylthiotransferase accessory factor
VPYHALSLDSTHPHKAALLFQTSTNGLASGNTVEEAMFHAPCEVIERDAYYHWHQLPGAQKLERLVANNSINSELAKHLLLQLYQAAIDVKVWDLTSNLGIPAFQCVLSDQAISRGTQVFAGKGCHFDKEIALMRAITEAIQVRLTFITGSRDDVFPSYYKKNLPATHLDLIGKHDYQTIAQPTYQQNFTDNVKDLVQLFNKHGYPQVIAVNHTRTDIGIPVVHMLVPKLNVLIEAA